MSARLKWQAKYIRDGAFAESRAEQECNNGLASAFATASKTKATRRRRCSHAEKLPEELFVAKNWGSALDKRWDCKTLWFAWFVRLQANVLTALIARMTDGKSYNYAVGAVRLRNGSSVWIVWWRLSHAPKKLQFVLKCCVRLISDPRIPKSEI